ncbi:MAG: YlxR family protein [Desulfovibrionaceae bacterium]|nr:YlxR family protein [Desulfovibrionaceae bacterium]
MTRHTPVRSCTVCRLRFPKRLLLRFVQTRASGVMRYVSDEKQILPGRGVYLCSSDACLERGRKKLSLTAEKQEQHERRQD